jgi:glucose/arabinose dehydrogenase
MTQPQTSGTPLCVILAALVAAPLLALPTAPAAAAPLLPKGFLLTERTTGQPNFRLTAFEMLPDGGILSAGKDGRVMWASPDSGTIRTLATIPVDNTADVELVDLELAPDFVSSRRVYTVYARLDAAKKRWPGSASGRSGRTPRDCPPRCPVRRSSSTG